MAEEFLNYLKRGQMDTNQLKQQLDALLVKIQEIVKMAACGDEIDWEGQLKVILIESSDIYCRSTQSEEARIIFDAFIDNQDKIKSNFNTLELNLKKLVAETREKIKSCWRISIPYYRIQQFNAELNYSITRGNILFSQSKQTKADIKMHEKFIETIEEIRIKKMPDVKHRWQGFFITGTRLGPLPKEQLSINTIPTAGN